MGTLFLIDKNGYKCDISNGIPDKFVFHSPHENSYTAEPDWQKPFEQRLDYQLASRDYENRNNYDPIYWR